MPASCDAEGASTKAPASYGYEGGDATPPVLSPHACSARLMPAAAGTAVSHIKLGFMVLHVSTFRATGAHRANTRRASHRRRGRYDIAAAP